MPFSFVVSVSHLQCSLCTLQASKDDEGNSCVWCSLSSFGACVSEPQAEKIKKTIPGIDCDDDSSDDDDNNDDGNDDDNNDNDDSGNDEYWKCLKEGGSSEKKCSQMQCSWCNTKAGYGICMDKEAAETAAKSDWYDCDSSAKEDEDPVADPYDTSCLMATLQGDEDSCKSTTDSDGDACQWCSVSSVQVCLTSEQAAIAEQVGGDCSTVMLSVK